MAAVGLGAIRLAHEEDPEAQVFEPADVDLASDNPVDPDKGTKIELPDGGVIVNIGPPRKSKVDTKFEDNLAESLSETELGGIADRLMRLIESDDTSRSEWLETRAEGIKSMGLKIEAMRSSGADGGSAPLEGMSNMRAIELCEAVVRFGANAFAELCPVDGPAKVTEIGNSTDELDEISQNLETDLNDLLLNIDKPYIPDTDAMLPRVGLDGSVFKKVYHDPILRRPVSRAVYGEDLIVDNSATSLFDAKRITHRVFMDKNTVKRMMLVGAYRDVKLGPSQPTSEKSPQERQTEEISGVTKRDSFEEDDNPYEFYETYCELDLPGFEHETNGKIDGLEVPYKVVIHKEMRIILEIRRNWKEDDEMCLAKRWFVQFPFIRGFGFYCIGLSHLLGNITNGITAMLREFIDAGMFANFPGGVCDKDALRQNSNINRAAPGAFIGLETGGRPIQQVVMAMPYKSPDAVFATAIQQTQQSAQRLGGTADVMVGEGRQDAPVGTTLALIEQAIKPLLATHKRLCQAQGDELQLICKRFEEDPESFVQLFPDRWTSETLLSALKLRKIVPRADPNTASHLQRMLRNAALYQMAKDDPLSFNLLKIRIECISGIGKANAASYLNPNPQPPPPDPKAQAAQLGAQADLIDAQTKAKQTQFEQQNAQMTNQNQAADRQAKLQIAGTQLKREQLIQQGESLRAQQGNQSDTMRDALDKAQDTQENQRDRIHEALMQHHEQAHDIRTTGMEHAHALREAAMKPTGVPE